MKIALIISLFITTQAMADIFDQDNREESPLNLPIELHEISRSVGALVSNKRIQEIEEGYELSGYKLTEDMNFCSDERFSEQSVIANCSGALIGKNKFLTSAHCFDEHTFKCENYSVVFDYTAESYDQSDFFVDKEDVYKCVGFEVNKFSGHGYGEDIAVITLEREVSDRKPLAVRKSKVEINEEIYMIGYPYGTSQKLTTDGRVESYIDETSFLHHLDTFSVNSGSPIFSTKDNKIIGVLVRGSGMNYVEDKEKQCRRWGTSSEEDGFAHGNFSNLIFK